MWNIFLNIYYQVWADYKQHVKVKCRRNANGISGTGGGPSTFCSLTPLEQRVSELLSIGASVSGMKETCAYGASGNASQARISIDDSSHDEDSNIDNNVRESCDSPRIYETEHSSSDSNNQTARKRKNSESVPKENLLQKQVNNQMIYQESSINLLKESNVNQNNHIKVLAEVNEHLTGVTKYLRRNCEWKEREFKLAKEKFEFKKKFILEKFEFKKKKELEKTKAKLAQLDLKRKSFELECHKSGLSNKLQPLPK